MGLFFIQRNGSLPPHSQLKLQIRWLVATGGLKPGDALPPVRKLARELGVGDAAVRRAYQDLRTLGLLTTEPRKYVAVCPKLRIDSGVREAIQAGVEQCAQLLAWAGQHGLHPLALGRVLFHEAINAELQHPSLIAVDGCPLTARAFAAQIAQAWEVIVEGLSLEEFAARTAREPRKVAAVLAGRYVYDEVRRIAGSPNLRVLRIDTRPDAHVLRRMARLKPGAAVLLVFTSAYHPRAIEQTLAHYRALAGERLRLNASTIDKVAWNAPGALRHVHLVAVSSVVWKTLPARLRRHPRLMPLHVDLERTALEQLRLQTGVLL